MNKQKPEVWISGRAALAILKGNSGRDDIPESYVRTLAKNNKIAKRPSPIDSRANEYLLSDVESYGKVKRRDGSKGETRAARASGSRRKASTQGENEESAA